MEKRKTELFKALIICMFIAVVFYLLSRSVFVFYAEYTPLEKVLAVLFLLSELFLMIQAVGYFSTVYRIEKNLPEESAIPDLKEYPPVAILVAARHEPDKILRQTFRAIKDLNYPNKTIYLLDDSSDEKYLKEAEQIVADLGINLFRREVRHGAKAGIVNDRVKGLSEKYVVIFDADQCPISSFLMKTIPLLEADPRLAFVQTPQFYTNVKATRVSEATNFQQAVFYEYICEGKSSGQAMICCGTNVVLRREALMEVGGLDETTVTEDFATSIKLHLLKWKSLYVNHVSVFGKGPEDLGSYFVQQNRWALGNVSVLRRVISEMFKKPSALKLSQWFEYIITGSYYFVGWSYVFLIMCPVVYILFGVPSFFMNSVVYLFTFVPYFVLSLAIFYGCMQGRNYTFKQLWKAQMLSFITMPIYMRASLLGLLGIKVPFQVTAKDGAAQLPYTKLWPQLLLWAINLIALTWGVHRFYYERSLAMIINLVWVGYHFILFSGIFYFNETEYSKETYPKLDKRANFKYKVLSGGQAVTDSGSMLDKYSFRVSLPDKVDKDTILMCKVKVPQSGENIIFDGKVVWVRQKRTKGCTVGIRIVRITHDDLDHIEGLIKK